MEGNEPGGSDIDEGRLLLDLTREVTSSLALQEVLDDYFKSNRELGHVAVTCEREGRIEGFAYYAPAAMTDRTWYLYWIAVARQIQACGLGSELLRHAEEDIRRRQGRLFLIETGGLPHYELTRKFYLKHGYERAAIIRDFYAAGDDMVVFAKRMQP